LRCVSHRRDAGPREARNRRWPGRLIEWCGTNARCPSPFSRGRRTGRGDGMGTLHPTLFSSLFSGRDSGTGGLLCDRTRRLASPQRLRERRIPPGVDPRSRVVHVRIRGAGRRKGLWPMRLATSEGRTDGGRGAWVGAMTGPLPRAHREVGTGGLGGVGEWWRSGLALNREPPSFASITRPETAAQPVLRPGVQTSDAPRPSGSPGPPRRRAPGGHR
jgi:hypothetical protein